MLTTTYQLLKANLICDDGYDTITDGLRNHPDKPSGGYKKIPLHLILEVAGFDTALWALRAVPKRQDIERNNLARIFGCDCATRVCSDNANYMQAITVSRLYTANAVHIEEVIDHYEWMGRIYNETKDPAADAARTATLHATYASYTACRSAMLALPEGQRAEERKWQQQHLMTLLTKSNTEELEC